MRECVFVNSSQAGIQMGNPNHEYRLRGEEIVSSGKGIGG